MNNQITILSKDEIYTIDSGLGGIFTLEYLGFFDEVHNFKSTSWFNTGQIYKIKEERINSFLKLKN